MSRPRVVDEKTVFRLKAEGLRNAEIARLVGCQDSTVTRILRRRMDLPPPPDDRRCARPGCDAPIVRKRKEDSKAFALRSHCGRDCRSRHGREKAAARDETIRRLKDEGLTLAVIAARLGTTRGYVARLRSDARAEEMPEMSSWAVEVLDEKQEPFSPHRWFTSYSKYGGICFTADPKHAKTFATPEVADEALDELPEDRRRLLSITHAPKGEEK